MEIFLLKRLAVCSKRYKETKPIKVKFTSKPFLWTNLQVEARHKGQLLQRQSLRRLLVALAVFALDLRRAAQVLRSGEEGEAVFEGGGLLRRQPAIAVQVRVHQVQTKVPDGIDHRADATGMMSSVKKIYLKNAFQQKGLPASLANDVRLQSAAEDFVNEAVTFSL